jgi:hypothetical protein
MPRYDSPLYRLSTQTGAWNRIIDKARYYSLSPTGRRLAYVTVEVDRQNDNYTTKMNILDLQTGKLNTLIHENTLAAAHIVWSADGTRMYYSVVDGPPQSFPTQDPFGYELFEYDHASGQLTLLKAFPQSPFIYYPAGLTEDGKLIIHWWGESHHAESTEYLDLTTKQMMTLTPTSAP